MKFALDCRRVMKGMSGLGSYTLNLVNALARQCQIQNHTLTIYALPEARSIFKELPESTEFVPVKYPVEDHIRGEFWKHVSLPSELRRRGCDVFHDPAYQLPLGMKTPPAVVTIHDFAPFRYPETNTWKYNNYWRFMTDRAVSQASGIITVSSFVRDELVEMYPRAADKVDVVLEAADPDFSPGVVSDDFLKANNINTPFVLTMAKYEPRKNLAMAIKAFAEFREKTHLDYQFVVAGGMGWKTGGVSDLPEALGIADKVVFTGYLEKTDLVNLVRGAQLVVVPSLYEGFGLPVLEAMACGTPVVCSETASLPEVGGDAAGYFDPTSVNSISLELQRVLGSKDILETMKQSSLAQAGKFSWEKAAEETLEVYHRVAGEGK